MYAPIRMLIHSLSKINLTHSSNVHTTPVTCIKLGPILQGEPPKAKKRMDPQLLKAREDRARRRLERDIRKLERVGKKLKPIDEVMPEWKVLKEQESRKRVVPIETPEQKYETVKFMKEWSNYRSQQAKNEFALLVRAVKAQDRAMRQLKRDNLDLYTQATQIDFGLLPYVREGPSFTPPIMDKDFEPPEGDYIDNTFLYDKK